MTLFALLLAVLTPDAAARDWRARVGGDTVTIADGKMTIDRVQLCAVKVPGAKKASYQLRTHAEAPVNAGVSRDFLVEFYSSFTTGSRLLIGGVVAKGSSLSALDALDCKPVAAPIGTPDLDLKLFLTGEGFQYVLTDAESGKTSQESKVWSEHFKD